VPDRPIRLAGGTRGWYGWAVLPLSEIVGLSATLDADGRGDVADAVAAAWGLPAGSARFWRSSATHVFAVARPAAYLRFVPTPWRPRERIEAVADLMVRLGPGVARPLPSVGGRLVETVATPRGPVHATLVAAAPGESVDVADLGPARAREWGTALARLHRDADPSGLPEALADLIADPAVADPAADPAVVDPAADPELAGAVVRLRAALAALPRDGDRFGAVHGDFEPDNIAWAGDRPTAYDFDDAGRSWFVADIAFALRDVVPAGAGPATAPLAAEFLAGYRGVRALSDVDLGWMPLFAAAHAAVWLRRLPAVLDVTGEGGPAWLGPLRDRLAAHARRQRELVLTWPARTP
jgi:Ser/Thr protein kinase RdoA (MazF antagonist)